MIERWKCQNCGMYFSEPRERIWYEDHGEGMRERWLELLCPVCGSDQIDECTEDEDAAEDSI